MKQKESESAEKYFTPIKLDDTTKKTHLDIDLNSHYERAFSELGLQQAKRDQIITLYLAIFSFLIPFALSMENLSWQLKGLIFMAAAIVGILFSLVIIRYRIYKEVYWLACQTITALYGFKQEALTKELIQTIYYRTLVKKGKGFCKDPDSENLEFSKAKYVRKNLFSSESIYFFIHSFITALIFGLSMGLIIEVSLLLRIIIAAVCGIALFLLLSAKYFRECIKVYGVLIDRKDTSFNNAFSKAWFLHFYA